MISGPAEDKPGGRLRRAHSPQLLSPLCAKPIYNWNNFLYQFVIVDATQYMTVQLGLTFVPITADDE